MGAGIPDPNSMGIPEPRFMGGIFNGAGKRIEFKNIPVNGMITISATAEKI
jgi:hypothetical protein